MPFYTFILEFEGGTYVSQVSAPSFKSAPLAWAESRLPGEISGMHVESLRELQAAMEDEPVPLTGLVQAWCASGLVNGSLALVHFVETAALDLLTSREVVSGPPTSMSHH